MARSCACRSSVSLPSASGRASPSSLTAAARCLANFGVVWRTLLAKTGMGESLVRPGDGLNFSSAPSVFLLLGQACFSERTSRPLCVVFPPFPSSAALFALHPAVSVPSLELKVQLCPAFAHEVSDEVQPSRCAIRGESQFTSQNTRSSRHLSTDTLPLSGWVKGYASYLMK